MCLGERVWASLPNATLQKERSSLLITRCAACIVGMAVLCPRCSLCFLTRCWMFICCLQLDSLNNSGQTACHCGAPNCRGVIEKSVRVTSVRDGDRHRHRHTQTHTHTHTHTHTRSLSLFVEQGRGPAVGDDGYEEVCHKCRGDGTLLLCDFAGCPRAYHAACAGLPPSSDSREDDDDDDNDELWYCPAHKSTTV